VFGCDLRPRLVGQITWRDSNPEALNYVTGDSGLCSECGDSTCPSSDEFSSGCLLTSFAEFVVDERDGIEATLGVGFDSAHLLTGADLNGQLAGLAYLDSVCSDLSAGLESTASTRNSAAETAALVAHELGHTLGMQHDSSTSTEYLMAAVWSGQAPATAFQFSDESRTDTAEFFADHYGTSVPSCLDDAPPYDDDALWARDDIVETTCGDGIVDDDEDCDAGVGIVDSCCRDDCTLDSGCDCSPLEGCCDESGSLMAAGAVCRDAQHAECDVEEVCSGVSGECPADAYESPGASCTSDLSGGSGRCYHGACIARADNCIGFVDTLGNLQEEYCDDLSTCGELWCTSSDDDFCYSNNEPALAGTSCGSGRQCADVSYESTADFATASTTEESTCVDSDDLKEYRWDVDVADPCRQDPPCVDEAGTEVADSFCGEDYERPGYCTEAPSASPKPSTSRRPTLAPSGRPTSAPSMTPVPSATPTEPSEDGSGSKSSTGISRLVRNVTRSTLFRGVLAIVVGMFLICCCCCYVPRVCCRSETKDTTQPAPTYSSPEVEFARYEQHADL